MFAINCESTAVAYPEILFVGGGGDSTNLVEDRGQSRTGIWGR